MSWWKHYDKSRWQQERERLHLMDTAPAPPDPDISIKTTIRDIFSRMNAGEQSVWRQVEQEWNNLAGTVIARHTSPVRLDHKMLVVAVDSAVWLNELIRFERAALLVRLQQRVGKDRIKTIHFQADPRTVEQKRVL